MSQFKKTGNFFCSTFGGSGANPGTAVAPYAHPSSAPNSITNRVVCSGYFKGGWTGSRLIVPDGPCVIDLQGATVTMQTDFNSNDFGANPDRDFIWVRNGVLVGAVGYKNVILDQVTSVAVSATNSNFFFRRGIYLPNTSNLIIQSGANLSCENCLIFENVEFIISSIAAGRMSRCYLDKDKYIEFKYPTNPTTTQWNNTVGPLYSILNGRIVVGGVNYELKRLKDGTTRPDANPAYLDFNTIYPNVYTNGNYAGDMKFIDIFKRKVQPDSDVFHNSINRDNTLGWIGGVEVGRYIKPDDPNFEYSFSTDIDDTDPLALKTASSQPFGKIRITGKVSDNLITAMNVDFSSILKFDATVAGGVTANNNVPDASRDMGLSLASFIPRRFSFKVRTSTNAAANQASASSIWDNDGKATAGTWFLCEFNKPINLNLKSGVHYGNADHRGFVPDSVVNINFRSIDIEVILDQEWDIV